MPASALSIENSVLANLGHSDALSKSRQRQQRLTTIGQMTAEIAHQVRTPLASAMLYASQLDTSSKAQERIVAKINERLGELGRLLNDMLGFAAGGSCARDVVDICELLEDVASTADASLGEGSSLTLLIDGCCIDRIENQARAFTLLANADALKGALINLVTNADQVADGSAASSLVHGATIQRPTSR